MQPRFVVLPDHFPNQMWQVIDRATGFPVGLGEWHRTRSEAKAQREADKLNRRKAA